MNNEHEYPTGMNKPRTNAGRPVQNPRPVQKSRPAPGRYLKETPAPRRRRRRRKQKSVHKIVIVAVLVIAIVAAIATGIALCVKHLAPSKILGRWDLDGTTMYEFDKDGKGALVLSYKEYEFQYEIEDGVLHIDFPEGVGIDAQYTFEVKDDLLFMTGGTGDAKKDYVLRKVE
jgi:hypothetical protein